MTIATRDDFLTQLRQSNLLDAECLQQAQTLAASLESASDLADRLFAENLLTRWQAQMLLKGQTAFFLGRYKLLRELGRGGMGTVFFAEQSPLGRQVAVKVMARALLSNPEAVQRFRREIEAAAALAHPQIVTALDADCAGDNHFLVMDYVPGTDLAQVLKRHGRLSPGEACEYVRQAAVGLQHAFEHGMVHRDIKPSNLLLAAAIDRAAPSVKILDFGLARFVDASQTQADLTHTGQIMGTPDYISPEQARESHDVDIRSDIYSLGATLYHLLTGEVPFPGGTTIQRITARLTQPPPRPKQRLPQLSDELDHIVCRMLATDPDQRFQTPNEVVQVLTPFAQVPAETVLADGSWGVQIELDETDRLAGETVDPAAYDAFLAELAHQANIDSAPYATTIQMPAHAGGVEALSAPTGDSINRTSGVLAELKAKKRTDRRRLLIWSAAVILVGGMVAGYVGWQRANRNTLVLDWPADERDQAEMEVDGARRQVPARGPLTFASSDRQRSVKLFRPGYEPIEQDWTIPAGEQQTFRPEWIPTAQTLQQREVAKLRKSVQQLNQQSFESLPTDFEPVFALQRQLADFRNSAGVDRKLATELDALRRSLPAPADHLSRADIPIEELTAAGLGDPDRAPAELVAVIGDSRLKHWYWITDIAISPDRRWIASASGEDAAVVIWDVETGRAIHRLRFRCPLMQIAFSPDGQFLAANSATDGGVADLVVWRTSDWSQVRRWRGQPHPCSLCYTPDGQLLITASADPSDHTIVVWDAQTGKRVRTLTGHTDSIHQITLAPSGEFLASVSSDGSVRLWDVSSGTQVHSIEVEGRRLVRVAFAPDGKSIATGSDAPIKQVQIWDVESGTELKRLETGSRVLTFAPETGELLFFNYAQLIAVPLRGRDVRQVIMNDSNHFGPQVGSFSPDGELFAGAGYRNVGIAKVLQISAWDPRGWKRASPESEPITALAVDPSGTRLVVGRQDGLTLAYDLAAPQTATPLVEGSVQVTALEFSHDGSVLALGFDRKAYTATGEVELRDATDSRLLRTIPGGTSGQEVWDISFAGSQQLAICVGDAGLSGKGNPNVTEVLSGRQVLSLDGYGPWRVLLHPDRPTLYFNGEETHAFNTETRTQLFSIQHRSNGIDISPGGELLALSGVGIRIVNAQTGSLSHNARGAAREFHPEYWYSQVCFSPDGRVVAAATSTGSVELWDIDLCERLRTLQIGPPFGWVHDLEFTPDGRHLVTLNGNGTVYVLRLEEWSAAVSSE